MPSHDSRHSHDPYDDIRSRLENIATELGDLAMVNIRDQLELTGDTGAAKAEERRVSRARRAVLKASTELQPRGRGSEPFD